MLARHELDEIGQLLLAAADKLETNGHVKWSRHAASGGFCALGAIGAVLGEKYVWADLDRNGAVERLAEHLPETIEAPSSQHKVAFWNNKNERTAQEVIDKFREVAYDPQYAKVTV